MTSELENDLLTRIGPGRPMGNLRRRYWHVVAAVEELATQVIHTRPAEPALA
jgi:5,5'-dehydrodivanillate O-demethylase